MLKRGLIGTGMLSFLLLVVSCASQQSLQEYYVDNSENPNFISVSIPASVLNLNEEDLSQEEREAIGTLRKFNVLAFRIQEDNKQQYKDERKKVREILSTDEYEDLMSINTEQGKGVVKILGEDDAIEELILFGDNKEQGFMLVRILGKNMNPAHAQFLISAMQKSDFQGDGLEVLGEFFKGT